MDSEPAAKKEKSPAEGAVNGEHTCPDCGMSFDRRYSLIMHTLKHEKSRGYKCNVSIGQHRPVFSINVGEECVTTPFFFVDVCSCVIKSSSTLLHSALTWHDTSSRAATERCSVSPRPGRFPRGRETVSSRTRPSRRTPSGSLSATSAERPCRSCTPSGSTCWTTPACDLTPAKCAASPSPTSTAWASTGRCTGSPSSSSVNTARSYL